MIDMVYGSYGVWCMVEVFCTDVSHRTQRSTHKKVQKEHKEIGLESKVCNFDIIYGVTGEVHAQEQINEYAVFYFTS